MLEGEVNRCTRFSDIFVRCHQIHTFTQWRKSTECVQFERKLVIVSSLLACVCQVHLHHTVSSNAHMGKNALSFTKTPTQTN